MKRSLSIGYCWSVDCIPCKKEIPEIVHISKKNSKLTVFFINIDAEERKTEIDKYIDHFKIQDNTLLDTQQTAAQLFLRPKVLIPSSVLINSEGYIIYQTHGYNKNTIKNIEEAMKDL